MKMNWKKFLVLWGSLLGTFAFIGVFFTFLDSMVKVYGPALPVGIMVVVFTGAFSAFAVWVDSR